jgi:hypothetical protein
MFSPPKEWEDWVSMFLGIWLCISPWALHFTDDTTATNIVLYVGFIMIAAEVITLTALGFLEELIDVVLGVWLLASVWLFDISTPAARIDLIVSGLVVLLFSFYEIWDSRRTPATHA